MSDRLNIVQTPVDPLDGLSFIAGSDAGLIIRPSELCARFSLRISQDHLAQAAKALQQEIPARIGEMSSAGETKVLCLGPDEWLILAPDSERGAVMACLAQMAEPIPYSLVDVSHSHSAIEVSGPMAALALRSGCPLNLETLPIGGCARTILDKAQIVLMRLDDQHYRLDVLRSYAKFAWRFLSSAGGEIVAAASPQADTPAQPSDQ